MQKNATHILFHKNLTNCDIGLIVQVVKEDLLHERLKLFVCQNLMVNSKKDFLSRTLGSVCAVQRDLCSTETLSPKVPMSPLS